MGTLEEPSSAAAKTESSSSSSSSSGQHELDEEIIKLISSTAEDSKQWGTDFDLVEESPFYNIFSAVRSSSVFGPKGRPFYFSRNDIDSVMADSANGFAGYFTFDDMAKALTDDFLDASRGTADNRKGWKV